MDGDNLVRGPEGTALRIFEQASKNNFQSEKHGKAIFDTSIMVEVMVPGSRESTPLIEVERIYCPEAQQPPYRSARYNDFADAIENWKAKNTSAGIVGTPIDQWPQIDAGTAATLKSANILSVEMLASVSDGNLMHLGIGGATLREQARGFLSSREFGVPSAAMSAENVQLREQNTALANRVRELESQLAATTAAPMVPAPAPAPSFDPAPAATVPAAQPIVDFTGDVHVIGDPATPPAAPVAPVDPFATNPPSQPPI